MSATFETIKEGDALPPISLTPDLGLVIRFAVLGGWNLPAFFYDDEAAKAHGMPGRMVPGPLKLGFLYRVVDDWLGGGGFVRHVRAAHRRPDTQGREITITGSVARVYEEAGFRVTGERRTLRESSTLPIESMRRLVNQS